MARMKKRLTIAVTVAVWLAAFGSWAALSHRWNRASHLTSIVEPTAPPLSAAPASFSEPVSELQSVLYVPAVTIRGRPDGTSTRSSSKRAVGMPEMNCADWRGLDMGSGRVRVCD
jgi:hypothetical protein